MGTALFSIFCLRWIISYANHDYMVRECIHSGGGGTFFKKFPDSTRLLHVPLEVSITLIAIIFKNFKT